MPPHVERISAALEELRHAIIKAERGLRGAARVASLIEIYTDEETFLALRPHPIATCPHGDLLPTIRTNARGSLDDREGHDVVGYSVSD